ncbi:MAG TPA: hypothetical protein VIB99_00390, partial [Candidatus Limnocylindrales bacterium]
MKDEEPYPAERVALPGRHPADRRVRVARPHSAYFRYEGPGTVTAKREAIDPVRLGERLTTDVRRLVFGRALASDEEGDERLSKLKALAVFSSDMLSSVAYATEASMLTLL